MHLSGHCQVLGFLLFFCQCAEGQREAGQAERHPQHVPQQDGARCVCLGSHGSCSGRFARQQQDVCSGLQPKQLAKSNI